MLKMLNTCFSHAHLWRPFDRWYERGLVLIGSILRLFMIISPNFPYYTGGLKARRSFLQLIWPLCVYVLWNECNSRLFKKQECSNYRLLDKVKSYSLWWLKGKNATFILGTHLWWSSPPNVFGHRVALLLFL